MDWAKIAWFVNLPLVAVGWLAEKFDIHIPFTRAGFVLTLARISHTSVAMPHRYLDFESEINVLLEISSR
jgi:hypothetical protein